MDEKTQTIVNEDIEGEIQDRTKKPQVAPEIVEEMVKAGLIYGHKKSKTNPKFKQYIFANRNGVEIIDVEQTVSAIDLTAEFLSKIVKEKGLILFLATQPAAKEAVKGLAEKLDMPYINERWIGGLITNFKIISKRIEHFKKIQDDFKSGKLDKYTKKERVMIARDIERMKTMFSGLENLSRTPDAIFIIDPSLKGHDTAVHEAKLANIKLAAVIDSDDNPEEINYPIPANDHAKTSVDWIINRINQRLAADK